MSDLSDVIAKERAELDAAIGKSERDARVIEQATCRWCGRIFLARDWDRWNRARWIPEAGCVGHQLCFQRMKERR